jgi:hypothetical protein
MKNIILITQSKGGSGKSILTFLLAEKHPEAIILEMDDATRTTSLQLAYRDPRLISFLDEHKVIDRGRFDSFLEKIEASKNKLFLCDMGASISEQLPYYLSDAREAIPAALREMGIELELFVVVGGSNIFVQTMEYLDQVRIAASGDYPIKVFANQFYDFMPEQRAQLDQYIQDHQLPLVPFDISASRSLSTQNKIREMLKSGKGISQSGSIYRTYFTMAIAKIPPVI